MVLLVAAACADRTATEGRAAGPAASAGSGAGGSTTSEPGGSGAGPAGDGAAAGGTAGGPARPALTEARISLELLGRLDEPVAIAVRPGDPVAGRVHVAERGGRVLAVGLDPTVRATPVADLSGLTAAGGERGLLGIAFSPDGRRLYVNYTDRSGDTNVDELPVGDDGTADVAARRRLLLIEQPYSNHNGGHLTFGPDGMLYIGTGDGGSSGDPEGNGQDLGTLLGKVLRIDPTPSGGRPYTVPDDNPFVATAGARPEIWSYGLRNPWRFSFDEATGDLWIADVGQNAREEVNVARAADGAGRGINFGWNAFEGTAVFDPSVRADGAVPPVHEYEHDAGDGGCSVTGGLVYRGRSIPGLAGAYLFADYCTGGIRALDAVAAASAGTPAVALLDQPSGTVTFGTDAAGEILVATLGGALYRVVAEG